VTNHKPENPGSTVAYWTHRVDAFPGPVAQFRMAQLIDFDTRLYETARVVYRFLVGWYHDDFGDALLSQRHVAKVMKQRAPEGSEVPTRSAVQRAIIALMETGWVARTSKGRGKGKGASRYVPVINVLDLASQGIFPRPAHDIGPVEPAHANGPKTRLPEPVTRTRLQVVDNVSAPVAGEPLAAAPADGFERLRAAYDYSDEKPANARRVFRDIAPDANEVEHMIASAASWKRTANGKRMSLERWLREKRWLKDDEFANDNRQTHKWPSCVITRIKPRLSGGDFDGAQIWFRDRDGSAQTRVLDSSGFNWLRQCCYQNARLNNPSDDLHEFVGARFQLDENGMFDDPAGYETAA